MPRLRPMQIDELPPDLAAVVRSAEEYMGFIANDALTMAYKPATLRSVLAAFATELESSPLAFASRVLRPASWQRGPHG